MNFSYCFTIVRLNFILIKSFYLHECFVYRKLLEVLQYGVFLAGEQEVDGEREAGTKTKKGIYSWRLSVFVPQPGRKTKRTVPFGSLAAAFVVLTGIVQKEKKGKEGMLICLSFLTALWHHFQNRALHRYATSGTLPTSRGCRRQIFKTLRWTISSCYSSHKGVLRLHIRFFFYFLWD